MSEEANKSPSDVLKWTFCDDSMKDIKAAESQAAQELRRSAKSSYLAVYRDNIESVLAELAEANKRLATVTADRNKWIAELEKANHEYTLRVAERDKAQACTAEMRCVLEQFDWEDACVEAFPTMADWEHALSTDCGRGYVPVSELGDGNPWPVTDVLRKLAEGVDLLLKHCGYDGQGHEELSGCRDRAIQYANRLEALKGGKGE